MRITQTGNRTIIKPFKQETHTLEEVEIRCSISVIFLLPSLHHYFDGFTNEVPIVKDGSSTGEPGTPTETYQFTPEDVGAMVYR